jgi:nucleotide-binding universal stress UspA family protein
MKLVKRILVATDFSPSADDALKTATSIAKQFQSEVLLLHVIPGDVEATTEERQLVEKTVAKRLQERADQLQIAGVPTVETLVRHGVAFSQIDAAANECDVNVIVIGAGKLTDAGQFYLGTTAGRLRRKAAKPVWVVSPESSPTIDKILCPVDFSSASARALRNAIHLARGLSAELTVMSVLQSLSNYYEDPVEVDDPIDQNDIPLQTRAREMDRFLQDFDWHGIVLHKIISRGKPHHEIVRMAREQGMKLIVMGSIGRTGVARILIGGVARKVAQQMPCSIITVRSSEPIKLSLEKEVVAVDPNFCARRTEETRCERYEHGMQLLEQGLAEEALVHFQDCIAAYDLCPRAWQNLATAHDRLGHKVASQKCQERADKLAQVFAGKEINSDVRENHELFRSIFGT